MGPYEGRGKYLSLCRVLMSLCRPVMFSVAATLECTLLALCIFTIFGMPPDGYQKAGWRFPVPFRVHSAYRV